jgi:hypothetical protein
MLPAGGWEGCQSFGLVTTLKIGMCIQIMVHSSARFTDHAKLQFPKLSYRISK